jgi:tetratricopeptide (TPR) repeat protein
VASEQARDLRERGIQAAKAGQKDQARDLLQQSLRLDPKNEAAWLWLASVARDKRERVFCLQNLLKINPNNEPGIKALQALGIAPEAVVKPTPKAEPPPAPQPAPAAPPPPIIKRTSAPPRPSEPPRQPEVQRRPTPPPEPPRQPASLGEPAASEADADLQALLDHVEAIAQNYLSPPEAGDFTWVHKTRRRAGERDIVVLRAQIAGAILGVILLLGIAGFIFVATNPDAQAILFAPTWTPSNTPTTTPTNTPGFTPTPSPTLDTTTQPTYTPSPTIPPSVTPGDLRNPPKATALYLPNPPEKYVHDVAVALGKGDSQSVMPTLEAARNNQSAGSFDPNPYYYQALAFAQSGDTDRALRTLDEATGRIKEVSSDQRTPIQSLLNVGYAIVNLQLAQDAIKKGDPKKAAPFLGIVEKRTQDTIKADPNYAEAYVLLSRRFAAEKKYDKALDALNNGLKNPKLFTDMNLRVEEGNVYYQMGEYDLAAQSAFEALYINPYSETARLLQVNAALAQGKAGLAVIYAQQYLFYFPGSVEGYKLLGDARVMEGNSDLALDAYSQALVGDPNDPAYLQVLVSRGKLYSAQRRYDLAREDFEQALSIKSTPDVQALRMVAAYQDGKYAIAQSDAESLLDSGVMPNSEIQLLLARILVDQAKPGDTADFQKALSLITNALPGMTDDLRPIANEYVAKASYQLEDYTSALNSINAALKAGETGTRHYLRGLILEARSQAPDSKNPDDDKAEAIREYEWVLAWNQVFPYPFAPDARQRWEKLKGPPPEVTPEATAEATGEATSEATASAESTESAPSSTEEAASTPAS